MDRPRTQALLEERLKVVRLRRSMTVAESEGDMVSAHEAMTELKRHREVVKQRMAEKEAARKEKEKERLEKEQREREREEREQTQKSAAPAVPTPQPVEAFASGMDRLTDTMQIRERGSDPAAAEKPKPKKKRSLFFQQMQ
ncbi:hypothetical protein KIPB_007723 [Kipferlia bialata]|uniref:Uncharacterized protein n=1 Tax=Kipferlia bialata TaxID=797122 RepID=A0A391NX80_9EUKA|nr:hypothetical protein KIPB_007723 [Kipferlia bialata]|eukprot:g7723.t1